MTPIRSTPTPSQPPPSFPARILPTRARRALLIQLPALVVLAACGAGAPGTAAEVRDSAGVRIVVNRGAPADTLALPDPAVRIGSTGLTGAEELTFELISDVAVAPDGRVYVVDNRGPRVAAFDTAGAWIGDVGREGKGPGEYVAPLSAQVLDDTLWVRDPVLGRLSRYTLDGTFVDAMHLAGRGFGMPLAVLRDGLVQETEWGQAMDPPPARAALLLLTRTGEERDTVLGPYGVPRTGWEWVEEGKSGMMVNPPALSVRSAWAVQGDRLLWVPPNAAEIRVHDLGSGELRRIIRLDRPVLPPTDGQRASYADSRVARWGGGDERRARILAGTTFADVVPPVTAVVADDEGGVWVAGHDPAALERHYVARDWDVLDDEGRVVRHVRFPRGFELRRVRGGRAYGISTLESDVQVVEVYRLR